MIVLSGAVSPIHPAGAATGVIHGTWTAGRSTHDCFGSTTAFTCRHTATSDEWFQDEVVPICIEAESTTLLPLATGCSVVLQPESGVTYVSSKGAGTVGACSTNRSPKANVPVVRIVSRALSGQAFDVPVTISNSAHATAISGTLFQAVVTVHVEGHWSHGCDDPLGDGRAVGTWSGTFDILV
jgi:hypothetical protein